ncbi:MAG: NAD(P)-dependent oxidoreductase, partial [Oceanipulchritudo sp.]
IVPRSLVEAGLLVSNWGPLPAGRVAEGALTLLLALLKGIVPQHQAQRAGHWGIPEGHKRGSVSGLRVGIYGLGVIGQALVEQLRPLQPRMTGFDPYKETWPEEVARADSLEALFEASEAVLITAALTHETRRSVGPRHLGRLVDGGIVINVARGAIIDQEALFAELESGRLRAGLDVLDTDGRDWVPEDHPCRQWPNLLLTAHNLSSHPWNSELYEKDSLSSSQEIALANVDRFIRGEPVKYSFDLIRYDHST